MLLLQKDHDPSLILFIYFWLCWVFAAVWAFSSCRVWGLLFVVVCRLHCGGFSCCGARALGARASVAMACGLSSFDSQAL